MVEYCMKAFTHGVPCALQHYPHLTHEKDALCGVSKDECLMAFQYWVNHVRPDFSDITARERLMCPMLWCRDTFDDQGSTRLHASTCQWLPNAWYWCPQCSRPEQFMNCEATGVTVPQNMVQRKDSKLRRAVTFFKHFGRKSSTKEKSANSVTIQKANATSRSNGMAYGIGEKGEMADTSGNVSGSTEIDGATKVHEMAHCARAVDTLPCVELSSRLSHAIQHEMPAPGLASLPPSDYEDYEFSSQIWRQSHRAELPSNTLDFVTEWDLPLSRDLDMSEIEMQRVFDILSENVSPISRLTSLTSGSVFPFSEAANSTVLEASPSNLDTIESIVSRSEPLHPLSLLPANGMNEKLKQSKADNQTCENVFSDDIHATDKAVCASEHLALVSTQAYLQELRELVSVVNNEWVQRISSRPDLLSVCSTLSTQKLFKLGVCGLQRCFQGMLANSFEDAFAIMHVACASAYMVHKDDESYCWDDLFQDLSQWQHAILRNDDRALFLGVLDRLLCPQGIPTVMSPSGTLLDALSHDELLNTLKKGKIVENCSIFLDGLDHARIPERNGLLLPEHLASYAKMYEDDVIYMIENITQPLQRHFGIEALRDGVVYTELQIRSGLLRNPREVEVTLLTIGKMHSQSRPMYERYQDAVTTLCDDLMRRIDPDWRNHHYAMTMEFVLDESAEIEKRLRLESLLPAHRPNLNVLDVVTPSQAIGDGPTSDNSWEAGVLSNPSPSTTASSISMRSFGTNDPGSTLTSPTTIATDSSFTTPPVSPVSVAQEVRCHLCDKPFKGTYGPTNLKRHLRYAKIHNKNAKFECSEPNCRARFGRRDNLNQHCQMIHLMSGSPQLQRRGALKRRREVEDEVGRKIVIAESV